MVANAAPSPRDAPSALAPRARVPHYPTMLLFGLAVSGIAGLTIPRLAGTAARANIVWAAFYLGTMLTSLALGLLTARFGTRAILLLGFAVTALGMAGLAVLPGPRLAVAAAVLGGGSAAVQVVTVLLVRAWYERAQWDTQLGTMQMWMGVGQVGGLLLVNVAGSPARAATLGALVLAVALLVALTLTVPPDPVAHPHRETRHHLTMHGIEGAALAHLYHLAHLRRVDFTARTSPLNRVLVRWGLLMLASIPVLNIMPLLLQRRFGLSLGAVGVSVAVVTALTVIEYRLAGRLSHKRGASDVLRVSCLLRALGMVILAVGAHTGGASAVGLAGYALIALAWPPLSISSTIQVEHACDAAHVGAGLGVYNAVGAAARVGGSMLGGAIGTAIDTTGMIVACGMIIVVAALLPDHEPPFISDAVRTTTPSGRRRRNG